MKLWHTVLITLIGVGFGAVLSWVIQKYSEYHLLRRLLNIVRDRQNISLREEFLLTRTLARKIKRNKFKPDVIIAVAPGGAMIGEWLSRRFFGTSEKSVPLLVIWVCTHRKKGPAMEVDQAEVVDSIQTIKDSILDEKSILLVTDICRSGNTLNAAIQYLQKEVSGADIRTASLLESEASTVHPRYTTIKTSKTICFVWKYASIDC